METAIIRLDMAVAHRAAPRLVRCAKIRGFGIRDLAMHPDPIGALPRTRVLMSRAHGGRGLTLRAILRQARIQTLRP